MHQVIVEGTRFLYLAKGEDIEGLGGSDRPLSGSLPDEAALVLKADDVRLAVFESMLRRKERRLYFLVWQDGRDLKEVDARVAEGSHTDIDFAAASRTVCQ